MKIVIVGSGYVGLVAAVGFCELGHDVISVDNDATKIEKLAKGIIPIHEEHLPELIARHCGQRLTFTTDLLGAVRKSEAIFIAVGTPSSENGEADLSYVEAVASVLASALDSGYKVIVEKSTVPVLTNTWIRRVLLLNGASPESFDIVSNPEFLREGNAVIDFLYPDRIVVGSNSVRARSLVSSIYEPLTSGSYYQKTDCIFEPGCKAEPARLIETSAKSAELIKHASNAFLAMKISFINAVANVCETVGADIEEVSRGIGSDSRIGPQFLQAGIGYGGSCFPKDLKGFHAVAEQHGVQFPLLQATTAVNENQRERFMRKIRGALWTLKGKRLAVLGLSFKGGTDDIRESPAISLVRQLVKEGCQIVAFDPAAMDNARQVLGDNAAIEYANSEYEAMNGAYAALILTDWRCFAELDLARTREMLRYPIIIDGRNLLDPAETARQGFRYVSIGRSDSASEATPTPAEVKS
jgi:UDPglucose 6-dehydrogenase